jgi:hypothetical protein
MCRNAQGVCLPQKSKFPHPKITLQESGSCLLKSDETMNTAEKSRQIIRGTFMEDQLSDKPLSVWSQHRY